MPKIVTLVAAAVVAFLLAGCAPENSLFPLFTTRDKNIDERLLGEWRIQSGAKFKPGEESARIVFGRSQEGASYDVTLFDFDKKGMNLASNAHLCSLGSFLFIDFGSPDPDKRKFAEILFPAIETHIFGRIHLEKEAVRIDFLDDEWVAKQGSAGKLSLAFARTPDGPVISAATEDLRKFALEHAADDESFSQTYSLSRTK